MILQRTIDNVIETARIEEVIGDFMTLRRAGSNYTALCPFHNEKTPSFSVSPTKNIYKCFGCGRSGDPIGFIMEHEKQTYPEAIRYLAQKYGIEIEETEQTDEQKAIRQERESLNLVNQFAQDVFVRNLRETDEGRMAGLSYFKERGYRDSTIEKFGLGYADKEYTSFKDEAIAKGVSEERLQLLGLVTKRGNDFFRGRVTFPIRSVGGKVIGFGARVLRPGPKDPKYLNSPESPVYNKRKTLYGMYHAKDSIRRTDQCFLVEGYTDVISLHQAGIENVVSSSGTSLTEDQSRAIQRFTNNITVLYDGDKAGVKAAMRGLDILLKLNMDVRLVLLPEGEDPDSTVKAKGSNGFLEYLETEAKDFILFKTGLLTEENAHDPIAMTRVTRDIIDSIALIPDIVKRAHYIKECSVQLKLEEAILTEQVNRAIQGNLKKESYQKRPKREVDTDFEVIARSGQPTSKQDTPVAKPSGDEYQERSIVRLLIEAGDLVIEEESQYTLGEHILDSIESEFLNQFDNPIYQRLINWYIMEVNESRIPTREALTGHEDRDIATLAADVLMLEFEYSPNWEEKKQMPLTSQLPREKNFERDSEDAIFRYKIKKMNGQLEQILQQIADARDSGDDAQMQILLKAHQRLKQFKSELEDNINSIGVRL